DHLGLLCAGKIKVVRRQSVAPASRAGVRLHEQCSCFITALKLDKVISTTKRSKLREPSLGLASPAKRRLPVIINRHAMAFGSRTIEGRAVLLDIVLGSSVNQVLEFVSIDRPQLEALAAGPE